MFDCGGKVEEKWKKLSGGKINLFKASDKLDDKRKTTPLEKTNETVKKITLNDHYDH